jgi:hypothetical protein
MSLGSGGVCARGRCVVMGACSNAKAMPIRVGALNVRPLNAA